jgi:hypothetical protein
MEWLILKSVFGKYVGGIIFAMAYPDRAVYCPMVFVVQAALPAAKLKHITLAFKRAIRSGNKGVVDIMPVKRDYLTEYYMVKYGFEAGDIVKIMDMALTRNDVVVLQKLTNDFDKFYSIGAVSEEIINSSEINYDLLPRYKLSVQNFRLVVSKMWREGVLARYLETQSKPVAVLYWAFVDYDMVMWDFLQCLPQYPMLAREALDHPKFCLYREKLAISCIQYDVSFNARNFNFSAVEEETIIECINIKNIKFVGFLVRNFKHAKSRALQCIHSDWFIFEKWYEKCGRMEEMQMLFGKNMELVPVKSRYFRLMQEYLNPKLFAHKILKYKCLWKEFGHLFKSAKKNGNEYPTEDEETWIKLY